MFHEEMIKATSSYFKNRKGNILVGHRTKSVIVLIPNSYMEEKGIDRYLDDFLCFLSENFQRSSFLQVVAKSRTESEKQKTTTMKRLQLYE